MMKVFQVDSFTEVPFRGNPAGGDRVVLSGRAVTVLRGELA